ncbi:MAG: hypothetical protein JWQ16_2494 [Novosphingobium sp.]|nr:hypothetical protein [Novosphingobium sp.]
MGTIKLPAYVGKRKRADGQTTAYWWVRPDWADPKHAKASDPKKQARAVRNGKTCPFETTALGTDVGEAITKAEAINAGFREWRLGVDAAPIKGTVRWLFAWYRTQDAYKALRHKTRAEYLSIMNVVESVAMKTGTFGDRRAGAIDAEAADKLYAKLKLPRPVDTSKMSEKEAARARARAAQGRERQAAYEMSTCRRIWGLAARKSATTGVTSNPFAKMKIRSTSLKGNRETSRAEYDLYRAKAREMGWQSMATAAALAFECCQRVWDVFGFVDDDKRIDRGIKWAGYREGVSLTLSQSKTANFVSLPLVERIGGEDVSLYPELEEELARTPRPDDGLIVRNERTGQPFKLDYMQKLHRRIRVAARLPDGMTFTGFRHGGITEIGDAGNEDVRAISGHTTLDVTKIYNKANVTKARAIAAKRREHIAMLGALYGEGSGPDGTEKVNDSSD